MKRYVWLQLKRTLRILPHIVLITAILLAGIAFVFGNILKAEQQSDSRQRFQVGVVGDTDNMYFELGKVALETLDSTRFAVDMRMMTEEEARHAMETGELAAYVIIPEGFVQAMRYGEVRTIQYVTTAGNVGVSSMFKEEITRAIMEMLTGTQKGIYGTQNALLDADLRPLINRHLNDISLEYADVLFRRSEMYTTTTLGISYGLPLEQYYVCGMTVFFLFLFGLPYAVLWIKKDYTLGRVLMAKGCTPLKQCGSEYIAYLANMLFLLLLAGGAAVYLGGWLQLFGTEEAVTFCLRVVPVLVMFTAFNLLIFELAGNMVSGVLMQFFAAVAMCYAAGCFYPTYALPRVLQTLSAFLPSGLANSWLAAGFLEEAAYTHLGGIVLYTALFLIATILARRQALGKGAKR